MEVRVGNFVGNPRAFFAAGEHAFGVQALDENFRLWEPLFERERAIAAWERDQIVATAGSFGYQLTVPGGTATAAAITMVGVLPSHRRRGILRRMMRHQLDGIHERAEPLAILWASEGSIYQRFGYGMSTVATSVQVPRDRSAFRGAFAAVGSIRYVELDEAKRIFPAVYAAVVPTRPGFSVRSDSFWTHAFPRDAVHRRRTTSPLWYVVHEVAGNVDGYATYRIRDDWDGWIPRPTVIVIELIATNPAAHLDLWRFLLDIDLMFCLEAQNIPPDDPLILNAAEPRRLALGTRDGLWLRIVDLIGALTARHYSSDGRLVVEVIDEFCMWNSGRWALTVDDGIATVEATGREADLVCDIADVSAAYLGGFSFTQLTDAGRVRELRPGTVARADMQFRTVRPPWCPTIF